MKIKLLMESWSNHIASMKYFEEYKKFFNRIIPRGDYHSTYSFIRGYEPDITEVSQELEMEGFKYIGEGSFRTTYAFPDNQPFVVKISRYSASHQMNKREVDAYMQTKYSSVLPKMYISADDYRWIVVEKVTPANYNDIIDYTGNSDYVMTRFLTKVKDFALNPSTSMKQAIDRAIRYMNSNINPQINLELTPFLNTLIDFSIEYDIAVWDLMAKNLGFTDDGRLVVLDVSVEQDITDWRNNK